jgi:hypothetical protein
MSRRLCILTCVLVTLTSAAAAAAEVLAPGSLKASPARPGSPSHLVVNASFDQPPGAQLEAYNVDIARGYRFEPRAAAGRCTVAQARAATCPTNSKIGSGTGRLSVKGSTLQRTQFVVAIAFYLMRPQRPGDIAGLVLAGREPESGVHFALLGRLLRRRHSRYGLELRFAHTARELPSGFHVQLRRVHVEFGTQRTVVRRQGGQAKGVTYHLLTNPRVCPSAGWPFLLTVTYSTGPERYTARAACS